MLCGSMTHMSNSRIDFPGGWDSWGIRVHRRLREYRNHIPFDSPGLPADWTWKPFTSMSLWRYLSGLSNTNASQNLSFPCQSHSHFLVSVFGEITSVIVSTTLCNYGDGCCQIRSAAHRVGLRQHAEFQRGLRSRMMLRFPRTSCDGEPSTPWW